MKKLSSILTIAALTAAFVSCDKLNEFPTFEASESFAAFEKASFTIDETGETLVIPVSIAAYENVKTNVSYTILDATTDSQYSAKKGVDFKDTSADGVLVFDGSSSTQYITIEILPHVGEYTGDLTFGIELQSASGLKLSAEKLCKVSISDIDHPLANILGEYVGKALDSNGGEVSWTLHLTKDPSDVTVVHIDAIEKGCVDFASWGDWSYVGTVSEDQKTIYIARGQKTEAWYQSADDQFILKTFEVFNGSSISGILDSGNIEVTMTAPGVWSVGNIWLYPAVTQAYYTNFCAQNVTWTKK